MGRPRYSHTSLATFRDCEQKFKYAIVDGLESDTDKWRGTKDLGSAFHEGIAEVLRVIATQSVDFGTRVKVSIATDAGLKWLDTNYDPNRLDWQGNPDLDYQAEYVYNREVLPQLFELHIPMLELGTRYLPVWEDDFFDAEYDEFFDGEDSYSVAPAVIVEYPFAVDDVDADGNVRVLEGIIDAVLFDKETNSYVLFDWKLRGRLLEEHEVIMDSQLMLYATVLNQLSEVGVSSIVMYQMYNKLPKPAKLTQSNQPSRAASASYWEYWWNSIPDPIRKKLREDDWYQDMVEGGKLRDKSSWVSSVEIPVTNFSMQEVAENTERTIDDIERRLEDGRWTRSWSSYGCALCQFKALCLNAREGGSEEAAIDLGYRKRL